MNNKLCIKRFLAAAMVLTVVSAIVVPTVFAKLALNTINPIATVRHNGRQIVVTGPIVGTAAGEHCDLRVTVTQRSTGAVAEGRIQFRLTGGNQTWEAVAQVQGAATFNEGPGTAVAMARTTKRGKSTDAAQWLVDVTLQGN